MTTDAATRVGAGVAKSIHSPEYQEFLDTAARVRTSPLLAAVRYELVRAAHQAYRVAAEDRAGGYRPNWLGFVTYQAKCGLCERVTSCSYEEWLQVWAGNGHYHSWCIDWQQRDLEAAAAERDELLLIIF